jgi:hypothetical protein
VIIGYNPSRTTRRALVRLCTPPRLPQINAACVGFRGRPPTAHLGSAQGQGVRGVKTMVKSVGDRQIFTIIIVWKEVRRCPGGGGVKNTLDPPACGAPLSTGIFGWSPQLGVCATAALPCARSQPHAVQQAANETAGAAVNGPVPPAAAFACAAARLPANRSLRGPETTVFGR